MTRSLPAWSDRPRRRLTGITEGAAFTFGQAIAAYSRWVVNTSQVTFEGDLPPDATIIVTWHGLTLTALAVHAEHRRAPYCAFVTPGLAGVTMKGWLNALGMVPVPLPRDGEGNAIGGLTQMARALRTGQSIGIAPDGPRGPQRVMRPGALWVAKLSGRPLVVLGVAARPAVRLPRWDHHLFPIPGARIAVVYGEPIMVGRQDEIDDNLTIRVATALNAAEEQARAIVRPSRLLKNSVSPPGRD